MSNGNEFVEEKNMDLALITFKNPKAPMSEAYRVLRTNLGFMGVEHPFRSVLVTSALAEEGKSTIAANLAVVTAQAGYSVMLVDCDLRKPNLHKIFQIPNSKGFTNCILQGLDPEEVAYQLNLKNLKVLTSGPIPPNPAELLNSASAAAIWTSLASKYDYVFVDSPPLLAVADASIIAAQVDGTVMVVRSGSIRNDTARQAKEQLSKAKTRMLGVVLNRVKNEHVEYEYA